MERVGTNNLGLGAQLRVVGAQKSLSGHGGNRPGSTCVLVGVDANKVTRGAKLGSAQEREPGGQRLASGRGQEQRRGQAAFRGDLGRQRES